MDLQKLQELMDKYEGPCAIHCNAPKPEYFDLIKGLELQSSWHRVDKERLNYWIEINRINCAQHIWFGTLCYIHNAIYCGHFLGAPPIYWTQIV